MFRLVLIHGGVIEEYPYFSHDVAFAGKEDTQTSIQNQENGKTVLFTFDPKSIRALKEYIWIDHQ